MNLYKLKLIIILLLSNFYINAQNFHDKFWPFDILREEVYKSNPYNAIKRLYNIDSIKINENKDFYAQALMTSLTFCGDIYNKNKVGSIYRKTNALKTSENLTDSVFAIDPKIHIINDANNYDILIINEAHMYPQHRIFLKSILKELYNLGYKHLCIEDFDNNKGDITYPSKSIGFYINEPCMAELVREGIRVGYRLHAYDSPESDNRDSIAAKNISNIKIKNSNDKILILCGFGHNYKENKGSLAYYLKYLHNFNILTIDQTIYSERETSDNYNTLLEYYNIKHPSFLISKNGKITMSNNKCDYHIISPKTKYINNRPDWLYYDNRKIINLKVKNNTKLIEVYYATEVDYKDAIPIERISNIFTNDTVLLLPYDYEYICKCYDENLQLIDIISL